MPGVTCLKRGCSEPAVGGGNYCLAHRPGSGVSTKRAVKKKAIKRRRAKRKSTKRKTTKRKSAKRKSTRKRSKR
jgi:hypothetical protein